MSEVFDKTESVCPVCLRVIEARMTVGEDGFIHMEKTCPEHGDFDALVWEGSLAEYRAWDTAPGEKEQPPAAAPTRHGCPYDCGLCRAHERPGCCVLLELTNRCNLRCPVCFAAAGERAPRDLRMDEIAAQYDMLMARGGPFNIQLSGGEPTVRDDLPEIMALGMEKGFTFFQINTNGLRLAQEEGYAEQLVGAGASCVFLQFDGLQDSTYEALRGRPLLQVKKKAMENCRRAGLPVVLVPTVVPGVNDDELGDILLFALKHMPNVRGVHFQPVSYFGRCDLEKPEIRLTIPRVLQEIELQTGGVMQAGHFGGGGAESAYCSFHASYMRRQNGALRALPRRQSQCCCTRSADSRDFVARQWGARGPEPGAELDMTETSALDRFLEQAGENTFTVSGMVFQDAWNLDLRRLRRCYICEVDPERGMVPFCAYNLTDVNGRALYRK